MMKRCLILGAGASLMALITVFAAPAGQIVFTDAERTGWETFLRTAKIREAVQMGGREATTSPWKLTLSQGEVTRSGLWKDVDRGPAEGGPDLWRYDAAAYDLDVLLGLGMIPPTVERTHMGRWGSLQLWIEDVERLADRMARGPETLSVGAEEWDRKAFLQRAFDSLIANDDRNLNNILIGHEDRMMILIDHSRAFRTEEPYVKTLLYGASGSKRAGDGAPYLFSRLPRLFVEKLRTMDAGTVKNAVKRHLNNKEIQALLARRDLILKEIDELVRGTGEAAVLY